MKLLPIFTAALFAATHSASARIGETMQECIQRYGTPSPAYEQSDTCAVFSMSGIIIIVDFINLRAGRLTFQKADSSPLTDTEVAALMHANCCGKAWDLCEPSDADTSWITTDGEILATRFASNGNLVIATKWAERKTAADNAKKLSGF